MTDYVRRFLIVFVMAVCIAILFIGGTISFAEEMDNNDKEWFWPTVGEVTDTYGTRQGEHYGIDIAAPEGTPILAVDEGVVTKSYYSDTYGNVIFISHKNGYETVYAHLHKRLANEGQQVKKGEEIGTVGNTGRSSGNHLHFEVHEGEWNAEKSNAIDPYLVLMDEPPVNVATVEQADYAVMALYHEEEDASTEAKGLVVTVQNGDTLWGLARTYQVPVEEIKNDNNLLSDVISVGQKLTINQEVNTYVIRQGDTLSKIASRNKVTVKDLKETNQLTSDRIYPGEILLLKK
ncbi:peptidoglycan DD-metalloendopeptidase family protein [Anaerobacillus sp. MEB173]|uniref:M23 family metallopeptidase n=1 Tax=Anaerobacillus sp. MEB173 TaxID=3383345 RepID=UPI003F93697D